jgi:hypothetical protein
VRWSGSGFVAVIGIRAEEDFEFGKDCFGLDQSRVRLYTAIARNTVLVMAALAICAVTTALHRDRRTAPVLPDQPPPAEYRADPAHRPGNRAAARPPAPVRQRRAGAGLATPPPGPITLVPPANKTGPLHRDRPGQLMNGCCRIRGGVSAEAPRITVGGLVCGLRRVAEIC